MSKKKQKTRTDKQYKKHDFSHLVRTKTAAKMVAVDNEVVKEAKSPLDAMIKRDLRTGVITIVIFVIFVLVAWLFFGKNGEIYNLTTKINLF